MYGLALVLKSAEGSSVLGGREEKEIIEKPEDAFLSWAERQKVRPLETAIVGKSCVKRSLCG